MCILTSDSRMVLPEYGGLVTNNTVTLAEYREVHLWLSQMKRPIMTVHIRRSHLLEDLLTKLNIKIVQYSTYFSLPEEKIQNLTHVVFVSVS